VVCFVFAGCLLWRWLWFWLWLLWTLADKSIGQYSEHPVLTLFGLDVCAVRSCSALLSGRWWFRAVLKPALTVISQYSQRPCLQWWGGAVLILFG